MRLAELIDLENRFIEDSRLDPARLRKRDRTIGIELESQNLDRQH